MGFCAFVATAFFIPRSQGEASQPLQFYKGERSERRSGGRITGNKRDGVNFGLLPLSGSILCILVTLTHLLLGLQPEVNSKTSWIF